MRGTARLVVAGTASGGWPLERACLALAAFGVPPALVEELRSASPDEIVWMGRVPARVDFLQRLPGIEFSEAWLRRVVVDIAGIAISFIGERISLRTSAR